MLNYGFKYQIDAANHASGDAWQARTEENKDRDHTWCAKFRVPGCRDLPGTGIRRSEKLQMPESDSMADGDENREPEGQLLEIGNGLKVCQTAFWLDVIPGI